MYVSIHPTTRPRRLPKVMAVLTLAGTLAIGFAAGAAVAQARGDWGMASSSSR